MVYLDLVISEVEVEMIFLFEIVYFLMAGLIVKIVCKVVSGVLVILLEFFEWGDVGLL